MPHSVHQDTAVQTDEIKKPKFTTSKCPNSATQALCDRLNMTRKFLRLLPLKKGESVSPPLDSGLPMTCRMWQMQCSLASARPWNAALGLPVYPAGGGEGLGGSPGTPCWAFQAADPPADPPTVGSQDRKPRRSQHHSAQTADGIERNKPRILESLVLQR